ncbi:MAG: NifU family protein [Myxococcota bacterium]
MTAGAQTPSAAPEERGFLDLAKDLEGLEAIVAGWEPEAQGTAEAMKRTVEEILVGALKRLIRRVKDAPGGMDALRASLEDDWVLAVLQVHGILKPPAPSREDVVRKALEGVRPMLESHGGDVELIAVRDDEVEVKLLGSCDGCSQSSVTVKLGIETAVRDALPEIERVVVREGLASNGRSNGSNGHSVGPGSNVHSFESNGRSNGLIGVGALTKKIESPFAGRWEDAGPARAVPTGDVLAVDLESVSVLLTRLPGGELRAYPNACTHLGMPLDTGTVEAGAEGPELVCRYHGFRYKLADGECLTAPEVALPRYPVRVEGDRVRVRVIHGGAA